MLSLANFLASMGLEFTRGYATKGLFLLPALHDADGAGKVHVSYTRVGIRLIQYVKVTGTWLGMCNLKK